MSKARTIKHVFVAQIPECLDRDVIYVSIEYGTAVHKCFCGCGEEVVTPLSPVDWKLVYDGESVSLSPSIGSWSLKCQSHYWIIRNQVVWAPRWSTLRIQQNRELDRDIRRDYYAAGSKAPRATARLPFGLDDDLVDDADDGEDEK